MIQPVLAMNKDIKYVMISLKNLPDMQHYGL